MSLTGFDIMEEGSMDDFKSLYEIFDGISQVWDDLAETSQSRVSEILGGTRQLQVISSILNNWEDAEGAYEDAMNSAGMSTEANETYMESIEAHTKVLKASMEELWTDTVSADFLNSWIDIGNAIVNVADNVGVLQTALVAFAGIMSARGNGIFNFSNENNLSKWINDLKKEFTGNGGLLSSLNKWWNGDASQIMEVPNRYDVNGLQDIVTEYNNLAEGVDKAAWAQEKFTSSADLNVFRTYTNDYNKQVTSVTDLSKAYDNAADSAERFNKSSVTTGFKTTLANIGTTIASMAANMALAYAASELVSLGINAISSAIDNLTNRSGQLIEAGEEARSTIDDLQSSFADNVEFASENGGAERLIELRAGVDEETNRNISLTNDEYDEYIDLCNQAVDLYPQLSAGADAQGESLLNLSSNVEEATEQLEEYYQLQKDINDFQVREELESAAAGEVAKIPGIEANLKEYQEQLDTYSSKLKVINGEYADELKQDLLQFTESTTGDIILPNTGNATLQNNLMKVLSQYGMSVVDFAEEGESIVFSVVGSLDTEDAADEMVVSWYNSVQNAIDEFGDVQFEYDEAEAGVKNYSQQLAGVYSSIGEDALTALETSPTFKKLPEATQEILKNSMQGIDWEEVVENEVGTDYNKFNPVKYVDENILDPLAGVLENTDVTNALEKALNINKTRVTVDEYRDALNEQLGIVKQAFLDSGLTEEDYEDFAVTLGFKVKVDEGAYHASIDEMQAKIHTEFKDEFENDPELEDIINNLTEYQAEKLYDTLENDLTKSIDEALEDALEEVEEPETKIKLSNILADDSEDNFSEKIDTFQSDIDELSSALDDLRNGEEINLTDLVQQFPELADSLDDLEGGLSKLSLDRLSEFSSEWKDTFSGADAEELEKINSLFNELVSDVDISGYMDQYEDFFYDYYDLAEEIADLNVDLNETTFGNIDTNNRQILEWTKENLRQYEDAIESWGESTENLAGGFSTVLSQADEFDGFEGIITFSPMLQTENGAVFLDRDTVYDYMNQLVGGLEEGASVEDLILADSRGLDVAGEHISGLVAGVTETADETERLGEAMHIVGDTGALESAKKGFEDINKELKDAAYQNLYESLNFSDNPVLNAQNEAALRTNAREIVDTLFDEYSGDFAAIEAIVKLSANPESANWDIEEWKSQIEDEEVYINIRIAEEDLNNLDKDLTVIKNDATEIQNEMSRRDAFGLKYDASLYRDLIANGNLEIQNLKEQIECWQDIQANVDATDARYEEARGEIISLEGEIINVVAEQQEWNAAANALAYEAGEALSAYNDATSSRNAGDNYTDMMAAFEAAQDLYEQGLIGTDEFKTAAAMLSPNGMDDVANWVENYDKAVRYFTEDSVGCQNALADLAEKTNSAGEAMATYDEETQSWAVNNRSITENANALGISLEAYQAIMGRLQDYGAVYDWFGTVEEGTEHIGDLYVELADAEQKMQDLEEKAANGEKYEGETVTDTVLAAQEDRINQIKQSILDSEALLEQLASMSTEDMAAQQVSQIQSAMTAVEQASHMTEMYGDEVGSAIANSMYESVWQDLQEKNLGEIFQDAFVFDPDTGHIIGIYEDTFAELWDEYSDLFNTEMDTTYADKTAQDVSNAFQEAFSDSSTRVADAVQSLQEYEDEYGNLQEVLNGIEFGNGYDSEEQALRDVEDTIDDIIQDLGLTQEEGRQVVQAILDELNLGEVEGKEAEIDVDADTNPFISETEEAISEAEGEEAEAKLTADSSEFDGEVEEAISEAEGEEAEIPMTVKIDEEQFEVLTGQDVDGTIDYEVGEVPTEIEEHATGLIDYEVGEVPTEVEEHATGLVDYQVGEAPTEIEAHAAGLVDYDVGSCSNNIPNASGLVDYKVGKSPSVITEPATGTVNYEVGEVPTEIEEHATGFVDYELGLYPPSAPEIPGLVDYDVGRYPDSVPNASGLVDYKVGKSPSVIAQPATGTVNYEVGEVPTELEDSEITIGINTDTSVIGELTTALNSLSDGAVNVTADVSGTAEVEGLTTAIDELYSKTVQAVAEVSGTAEVRALKAAIDSLYSKTVQVTAMTSGIEAVNSLAASINAVQSKTVTVTTVTQEVKNTTGATGTAHAAGTGYGMWVDYCHARGAYADGSRHDWALHQDEDALVNEVGNESIVLKMRLYIVMCIENLSNCWEAIKPIKLQHSDEINTGVNAVKAEKINWMVQGASLNIFIIGNQQRSSE